MTTAQAMHRSRTALDAPLPVGTRAELTVLELTTSAAVLGAFERAGPSDVSRDRRGSGGPSVNVSPGTLHVILSLARPDALVPCDPRRILNRYVRPLLRALTKSGALTHYFGRDTLSVAHRPVGQVGYAHDSQTRRTVFEALVAIAEPLQPSGRASLLGREPASLASLTGRGFDAALLRARVVSAYAEMAGEEPVIVGVDSEPVDEYVVREEPDWTSTISEAIGLLGAGRDHDDVFRIGGDLLASRDALQRLASRVAAAPHPTSAHIGEIVDDELASDAVALDGVRDLTRVRDVLLGAV